MSYYGLDLSSHNGSQDFAALKSAGNEFVILRAGYGWSTSQKDSYFDSYYTAAKAAGLKVGAYWYSYARTVAEAKEEANCFLEVIKGKQFEMPVFIDMEDADSWKAKNGNPSGATQAKIANEFMSIVEAAGYYTGIYSSSSWLNSYLTGLSTDYVRWTANWGTNDGNVHGTYSPLHQYTSVYTLNGKTYDRNICYVDFEASIKAKGLNGYSVSDSLTRKVNGTTYEVLRFPMKNLKISQGAYGTYSHQGSPALDLCGVDSGIEPTYAPCAMKLMQSWGTDYGNPVWFQSINKVLFADGTIDYATFLFLHDNYTGDITNYAANGNTWTQWQEFGDEGTAGRATGKLICSFV